MSPFDFRRLRRLPDVEAPELQAWDATDELLVRHALGAGVPGRDIAVIGDAYGAITLALTDAGLSDIRVHQDLVTGRRALANNAAELGIHGFSAHELGAPLLDGARLVLLPLPKSLAELEEVADAIARWASPEVVVVAGGRVKHMTVAQNRVLGACFATVVPQRAERKSRLVVSSGARAVPPVPPFPVVEHHDGLILCAHGGVFAGARIDIGTRVLRSVLDRIGDARRVVDLGCGTGVLAATFAQRHPGAQVVATDRSAAAVRSARATMAANGLAERVSVTLDDAASQLPDAEADLVLLNPPFHLGAAVHEAAGARLIQAAARLLAPGGEVWTVFSSALGHRRTLTREVGPTEQVLRTPKFTVTRSVRRG